MKLTRRNLFKSLGAVASGASLAASKAKAATKASPVKKLKVPRRWNEDSPCSVSLFFDVPDYQRDAARADYRILARIIGP